MSDEVLNEEVKSEEVLEKKDIEVSENEQSEAAEKTREVNSVENTQPKSAEDTETDENTEKTKAEELAEQTTTEETSTETPVTEKSVQEENYESNYESIKTEKIAESVEKENIKVEKSTETEKNKKTEKKIKKNKKTEKTEKENKSSSKEKTETKKFSVKDIKLTVKFGEVYDKLQSSIAMLVVVCIAAFIVMGASAAAIFFYNVKGHEQVLVPNVVGKKLEDALLDMQVKELYPKINLRYSNTPGDEGTILEQSPESGAIVRGYSRVNLVVSRGVVVDKVGAYVGMNIEELKLNLQTLFAGQTRPLIVLADPEYKPDLSDAGTILEQNPPEGTDISQPVTVKLIVSRGPNYDNTRAPHVIGQSVNDVLQTIARSKIIFDFTSHIATEEEKAGTVVSQDSFDSEYIPNYSRVNVEFAFPEDLMNDNVYGIFHTELSAYPYPVQMRIDAVPSEGSAYTILNFLHSGGNLTVPYAVPAGTKLELYVVDKETAAITVD